MFGNHVFILCVLSLLVVGQTATARAADSCQPVFDALKTLITTSSHSYSTGVVKGKTTSTETIYVQGKTYIFARGKWMVNPATPADVLAQELDDEKQGKSTCQFVRTESVNGEAAAVYSLRRETETRKEDGQMWISKATGRALREDVDVDYGGSLGKSRLSARFEYSNVKPPM
ncbi:MAG TPA: hypothetical protein VH596_11740 [Terriglobales bacterium]|jgi:hypothetical protein